MNGLAYMVIRDDDLGEDDAMPNLALVFGPARRTVRWRGRTFNLPSSRFIGIGPVQNDPPVNDESKA